MIDLKAAEADVITWASGPTKEFALELIAEIERLQSLVERVEKIKKRIDVLEAQEDKP
jgi:hypothetical protein